MSENTDLRTSFLSRSHWGVFEPIVEDNRLVAVEPFDRDPDPSPLLQSIPDAVAHRSRVARPAVREGWLKRTRGGGEQGVRGSDRYIEISWDRALDLVADELKRVISRHGNESIFAGSYGWASAGRFHHAQSQLKRFLVQLGGFTSSRDSYSNAAGSVLARHVVGTSQIIDGPNTSWRSIIDHTKLVVMFGGVPLRNTQVKLGGTGEHTTREYLARAKAAGVRFYNVSPLRDDAADFLDAEWLAPRPQSDTAILLGIAHTLVAEELHDAEFLNRYCVGFERFRDYLFGRSDGIGKDADWASKLSEIPADAIRKLARAMAASRTFIIMNWSLQRSDHGEQPFWAAIALAAMLGQIGRPGGGIGFGYGSVEGVAHFDQNVPIPTLPTGENSTRSFIPVARISDLLLNPGEAFQYNGQDLVYPDIRLVYWSGGNPFHHHQDLNRLVRAWQRPETIIVHEPWWTATARHADIVLPSTTPLERDDIGASLRDRYLVAMKRAISPIGSARDDYSILADLAERFGLVEQFTENLSTRQWLERIYDDAREQAAKRDAHLPRWPEFEEFWERGYLELPQTPRPYVLFEQFRSDPGLHPLATPSGRIEIFSERIQSFGYSDCLGHPVWFEPAEWLGAEKARDYPLHLLTTQPHTRLHSQTDMGLVSQQSKVAQREPIRINADDAAARGIRSGDVVRVFNDRGSLLAGAIVTNELRRGVVELSTGAWYDPAEPGVPGSLDKHGNPNVLTRDRGTSRLAQGSSAQTALVQIERFAGEPPPITAFDPPIVSQTGTPAT
ncbi:MAG TPA: molybdopterin guanine dinucleotide-containing S/N-oxide reductase [Candidatus Binataceae bacterium]|nr:molybdopterin guanine dinucleotide-containing S/N-oxide reductase [Candidatus Binataceae bacterium]